MRKQSAIERVHTHIHRIRFMRIYSFRFPQSIHSIGAFLRLCHAPLDVYWRFVTSCFTHFSPSIMLYIQVLYIYIYIWGKCVFGISIHWSNTQKPVALSRWNPTPRGIHTCADSQLNIYIANWLDDGSYKNDDCVFCISESVYLMNDNLVSRDTRAT